MVSGSVGRINLVNYVKQLVLLNKIYKNGNLDDKISLNPSITQKEALEKAS